MTPWTKHGAAFIWIGVCRASCIEHLPREGLDRIASVMSVAHSLGALLWRAGWTTSASWRKAETAFQLFLVLPRSDRPHSSYGDGEQCYHVIVALIEIFNKQQLSSATPGGPTVKNLPVMQETQVPSLGREDPLEKGMATRSSILSWGIARTEEPGGLQSTGSQSRT